MSVARTRPGVIGASCMRVPGRVEERVGDRADDRAGDRLARAQRGLVGALNEHVRDLRRILEPQDRVGDPVDARDLVLVERDLFPERAARALDDVPDHLVVDQVRVDREARVLRRVHVRHEDLPGLLVHLDVRHDRRVRPTVMAVGDPAARDDVLLAQVRARNPRLPVRRRRSRLQHRRPPLVLVGSVSMFWRRNASESIPDATASMSIVCASANVIC